MIKPVRVSFTPNNKQPGSSEMDCQCELALPHRRGGLRASCSCLTHLSDSSTLSLRKRRTRDTRSSFLLFVSMIHSTEVMTTGESKPVGLTYNWTASGSALSSPQHTCAASTPPLNHEDDLETLEKLFHLGSQLSHSGSAALDLDLLHLRPRPRLRAADHWGFLPLMHVYSHHVREDEWRENFIRMQISKSFWSGVKESEFWFCVSFSLQLHWMRRLWVYKNKVTLAVIYVLFCCAFFPFVNIMKLRSAFFKSYHRSNTWKCLTEHQKLVKFD